MNQEESWRFKKRVCYPKRRVTRRETGQIRSRITNSQATQDRPLLASGNSYPQYGQVSGWSLRSDSRAHEGHSCSAMSVHPDAVNPHRIDQDLGLYLAGLDAPDDIHALRHTAEGGKPLPVHVAHAAKVE